MQSKLLSQDGSHGKHHGRQDRYIGTILLHVAVYLFNLAYEPQGVLLDLGSINLGPFSGLSNVTIYLFTLYIYFDLER